MSRTPLDLHDLPLARQVDRVCDRYEAARRPRTV
jgi:hypothetical protein